MNVKTSRAQRSRPTVSRYAEEVATSIDPNHARGRINQSLVDEGVEDQGDVGRRAAGGGRPGSRLQLVDGRWAEGRRAWREGRHRGARGCCRDSAANAAAALAALRRGGYGTRRSRRAGSPGSSGRALQCSAPVSKSAYVKSRALMPRGRPVASCSSMAAWRTSSGSLPSAALAVTRAMLTSWGGTVDAPNARTRSALAVYGPTPGAIAQPAFGVGPAAGGDDVGGVVERSSATRVAETLPLAQHRRERRGRACLGRRPAGEERLPSPGDARDLRLLQHHLADEDRPRLGGRPPRQVMPPVHLVPAREPAGPHAAQFVRLRASSTLRRARAWRDTRSR